MNHLKVARDYFSKLLAGGRVPQEVRDLKRYFALYGDLNFHKESQEDGSIVAVSTNFVRGSIVTDGADEKELDENIKDAILTAFSVPSAYAQEAGIYRIESRLPGAARGSEELLRYAPAK